MTNKYQLEFRPSLLPLYYAASMGWIGPSQKRYVGILTLHTSECDILKKVFITQYGHFEFLVMSFVLTNFPIDFIDLMNRVIKQYLNMFIIVFINDILVYSCSKNNYVDHLRIMLQTLRAHQLFDKFNKCEFCLRLVAFLGQIISSDSIRVDPQKTKAVRY